MNRMVVLPLFVCLFGFAVGFGESWHTFANVFIEVSTTGKLKSEDVKEPKKCHPKFAPPKLRVPETVKLDHSFRIFDLLVSCLDFLSW